jgi:transcriptional regulator with XRE-family HTH domain
MEDSLLNLAVNLRKILIDQDLTVASLARKSSVPKTNIQGWLDGSSPNIVQLYMVASVLNMNIEELAFGKRNLSALEKAIDDMEIKTGRYEIAIKKIKS